MRVIHHEEVLPAPGEWLNDSLEPAALETLGIVVAAGGKLVRDAGGGFTVHGPTDKEDRARVVAAHEEARAQRRAGKPTREHHYKGASWERVKEEKETRRSRRRR